MAFDKYRRTGGFPDRDIRAFKAVASREYCVIASRELSPFATDLILDNYAAKPFAIKAKTCDFGPLAGFVSTDPRFCKLKEGWDRGRQTHELDHAFEVGAVCSPIFISEARLESLLAEQIGMTVTQRTTDTCDVRAQGSAATKPVYNFRLVKSGRPPGGEATMWGVYYGSSETPDATVARRQLIRLVETFPRATGLTPVYGMVGPDDSSGARGVKSTCSGDYDLWHVFPHTSWDPQQLWRLGERRMTLRSTMAPWVKPHEGMIPEVRLRALAAGLVYAKNEEERQAALQWMRTHGIVGQDSRVQILSKVAEKKEHHTLGNISAGIARIKDLLNAAAKEQGYTGGNVVQHSDYGGNPFGDIDYPLVFFVPRARGGAVDVYVAENMTHLKAILAYIGKHDFIIHINPHMWLPTFATQKKVGQTIVREDITQPPPPVA
jgi:hypothetical protein